MSIALKNHIKYYFLAALAAVAILVWYAVWRADDNGLTVAFLNVGQGDAIFIEAPNGNQALFDGGPGKAVLRELSQVMPFYDRNIDALILSHPNLDHLSGLVEAAKRYDVGMAVDSGAPHTVGEYEEWRHLTQDGSIKYVRAATGMRIILDQGVYLDILSPEEGEYLNAKNPNDVMVSARLVYGDTSFLLTGDMEASLERTILSRHENVSAEVLKVAHHGSRYSSTDAFLSAVAPRFAVIEVGKNNLYHHPTAEALSRIAAAGATILRTDTDGRIVFKSDGKNLMLEKSW